VYRFWYLEKKIPETRLHLTKSCSSSGCSLTLRLRALIIGFSNQELPFLVLQFLVDNQDTLTAPAKYSLIMTYKVYHSIENNKIKGLILFKINQKIGKHIHSVCVSR